MDPVTILLGGLSAIGGTIGEKALPADVFMARTLGPSRSPLRKP
jgi:hypothetical protein